MKMSRKLLLLASNLAFVLVFLAPLAIRICPECCELLLEEMDKGLLFKSAPQS